MSSRFRHFYLGLVALVLAGSLLGCDALIPWLDGEEQQTLQRCTPVASTQGPVGEWERLMSGREITAVAADPCDPRVVYASSSKRLFKTINGGVSWDTLSTGDVNDIEVDPYNPDTLYAVQAGGVLKSRDGGASWKDISEGLVSSGRFVTGEVTLEPKDSETLYLATNGVMSWALYKSTDRGSSWKRLDEKGRLARISNIVLSPANPQVVYAQSLSGLGGFELYASPNAGKTWNQRGKHQAKIDLAVSSSDPHALRGVERGSLEIVGSRDGGKTWNAIVAGLPEGDALRLAQSGRSGELFLLYVAEEAERSLRVYRWAGEGPWGRVDSDPLAISRDSIAPFVFARTLAEAPDRSLYLGTKGGLYRMKISPTE